MDVAEDRYAGRYRIEGSIAAGGMGEVYRATMATLDGFEKAIALKVVRPELAADEEFVALFVEEAKVAMSLSHANIVQAFDVGRLDDRYFIAMEYVDGLDLASLLLAMRTRGDAHLSARDAIFVAVEALKGLDYAHRRTGPKGQSLGIVHRDISPSNLLISNEGEVKVADFGIAQSAMRGARTSDPQVMGKVPYMAPEQLLGTRVDLRADLYAVGVVLYEMLTGRRAFSGKDEASLRAVVLSSDFTAPRVLRHDLSIELERIVLRAMSARPDERFSSAATMRRELETLAMNEGHLLSSADFSHDIGSILTVQPGRTRSHGATDSSAVAEPFDALLGIELRKVNSTEPVSVFVTKHIRPGSTERHPEPKPLQTGRPVRRRFVGRSLSVVITLAAIAAAALALVVLAPSAWQPPRTHSNVVDRSANPASRSSTGDATRNAASPASTAKRLRIENAGKPAELPLRQPQQGSDPPGGDSPGVRGSIDRSTPSVRTRERIRRSRPSKDSATARAAGRGSEPTHQQASLSVNTEPWSYVHVDGVQIRATPLLNFALTAGRHRLSFRNPVKGLRKDVDVDLSPNEHRRLSFALEESP